LTKMFQNWQRWRRFSLFFLASLVACCVFHAWLLGQAQPSVAIEQQSSVPVPAQGSQTTNSNAVQQGIEYYQVGKFTEAIAQWEQALPQISTAKDRAIVRGNLALAYRQIGHLDKAIAQWEQAIQIYRTQNNEVTQPALARLFTEQGQAYSDLGQHKRAIALLQSAIAMAQKHNDRLTEAAAQGAIGTAYWALGDYEQALESHQTSLNIARELNNSSYIAIALNNLGNVYVSRADRYTYQATSAQIEGDDRDYTRLTQAANRDRAEAKMLFEQSVQMAQTSSGLEEVRALMNLNRLLVRSQESGVRGQESGVRGQGSGVRSRESGVGSRESGVSNNLEGQLSDRDRDLILRNFNRARELLEKIPDSRDKAFALINLAESIRGQQSGIRSTESRVWSTESKQLLEEALAIARTIGDSRAESFALGSLGELYEATGDLNRALELNRTAQFAAQQVNAPDSLYLWQWHVGRMLKALGEREKAIAAYEQAIATLQSIRGDIVTANKDLQLDFREQVEPVYRELMALLLESVEKSGVRSQESGVRSQGLGLVEARHVVPLEESGVRSLIPHPKSKIHNPKSNASALKKVVDTLELLKLAELQNFFGDECVQVALNQGGGEAKLLTANTAVVYSVILDNQTNMILRSPDGSMTNYPIAMSDREIEQEINELRYFLESRATEDYLPQAQKLYNLLIRPLEADLAALKPSTVVFINDGVLRKVPMAALHDGQAFLIEHYSIATTPSLSLTNTNPLNRQNLSSLTLGLTVARSTFPPLANVKAEVETVNEMLGGTQLIDEAFTLSNLQTQLYKQSYPIVHIATHGKFGVDAETTFLVAYDQSINIEQLDNVLRSRRTGEPVKLLTLSACQTAVGDNRSTLGIAGVAVRAGVESALATLWYINDEATVPLIKEFYNQLLQANISKAEALRRAQMKMIADENYNHPAIWSPFILIGNWL
jgi:CHAT domain-containing protein